MLIQSGRGQQEDAPQIVYSQDLSMPKKPKEPSIDPTVQAAEKTSRRSLIGGIAAAVITVAGGIAVAFINGWLGSSKPNMVSNVGIYRVRITVINPQNVPVEDAKVWSSFGGEPKKVAGGWQFDIPNASKPQDGQLSIFALRENDFLTGQADLVLGNDYNPVVTIKLKLDDSARVRGQIVDEKNRAIEKARVFVVGYETEIVTTREGGNFELPAHTAVGQMVTLHAEKPGYQTVTQEHPAGNHPATLVLEKLQ
jgi:hypothetical protein